MARQFTLHTFFKHGYYEPIIPDGKLRSDILKKIKPMFSPTNDPIYVEVKKDKFWVLKGEPTGKWHKYTENYIDGVEQ